MIGIVLTGLLDDGTAGLQAVKRCGGIAIVQDPEEAPFPDMPKNALANVEVDHCLPVAEMVEHHERRAREARDHADILRQVLHTSTE